MHWALSGRFWCKSFKFKHNSDIWQESRTFYVMMISLLCTFILWRVQLSYAKALLSQHPFYVDNWPAETAETITDNITYVLYVLDMNHKSHKPDLNSLTVFICDQQPLLLPSNLRLHFHISLSTLLVWTI